MFRLIIQEKEVIATGDYPDTDDFSNRREAKQEHHSTTTATIPSIPSGITSGNWGTNNQASYSIFWSLNRVPSRVIQSKNRPCTRSSPCQWNQANQKTAQHTTNWPLFFSLPNRRSGMWEDIDSQQNAHWPWLGGGGRERGSAAHLLPFIYLCSSRSPNKEYDFTIHIFWSPVWRIFVMSLTLSKCFRLWLKWKQDPQTLKCQQQECN